MRSPEFPGQAAEAARYALLRRLAPALKHDLVVHLQSVTMMSEVVGARLEREAGLPPQLREQVSRLHHLARDAVASSLRVTHWLTPPDDEGVPLPEGISQTLDLIRNPLGFRGFALTQRIEGQPLEVARTQLQPVLAAAILHLSDLAPPPRTIAIDAHADHDQAHVQVRLCDPPPGAQEAGLATAAVDTGYRILQASDLQALGEASGLVLLQEGESVTLTISRWETTAPLGIAPR